MSGGYDFVSVDELAKEYQCPICHLIIKDSIELPCSHALCETCIEAWSKECENRYFVS